MGTCFNKKEKDDEEIIEEHRKKSDRGHIDVKTSLVSKTDRLKNDEILGPHYVYPKVKRLASIFYEALLLNCLNKTHGPK
jgi:hypothetical protein